MITQNAACKAILLVSIWAVPPFIPRTSPMLLPGGQAQAAEPTTTYFPEAVSITAGVYDWGTLGSFLTPDSDTYDIKSRAVSGGRATDWNASTHIAETADGIAEIKVTHVGQYSRRKVTQELYVYNFHAGTWGLADTSTIGNEDDSSVTTVIESDIAHHVSAQGELRVRIRGFRSRRGFYSWSNALFWEVSKKADYTPPNNPPTAVDDTAKTTQDTPVNIEAAALLANDNDADSDPLTIADIDTVSDFGGEITDNGDDTYTYTPPIGFSGFDEFTYDVTDGTDIDTGTVLVQVSGSIASDPVDEINSIADELDALALHITAMPAELFYGNDTYQKEVHRGRVAYEMNRAAIHCRAFQPSACINRLDLSMRREYMLDANQTGSYEEIAFLTEVLVGLIQRCEQLIQLFDEPGDVLSSLSQTVIETDLAVFNGTTSVEQSENREALHQLILTAAQEAAREGLQYFGLSPTYDAWSRVGEFMREGEERVQAEATLWDQYTILLDHYLPSNLL